MTEELKQAAQAALEQLEFLNACYPHKTATDASDALRRALTQRPAAQAVERDAFESAARAKWGQLDFERSEAVPEMYYNQRLDDAWIGFGFAVAWLRASLPTQPAAQATPEPVGDAPIWNSIQIASWIGSQLMHEPAMFERAAVCKFVRSLGRHTTLLKHSPKDHAPAPGVPEGWHMDREGDDVIVVRHQAVGLARATNPATSMHGQILFALCDDILQDRKSLAAAQAKGGDHG